MLSREFFGQNTKVVAKELIGKVLVSKMDGILRMASIVETEAYLGPNDKSAHARHGRTKRTEVLFNGPGFAYPHQMRGLWLLNVTTGSVGSGEGVLIRSVMPISNVNGKTCGPGLVGRAFCVDQNWYGHDMSSEELHFEDASVKMRIGCTPRIGVSKFSGEWAQKPLRFIALRSDCLSGSKSLNQSAIELEN